MDYSKFTFPAYTFAEFPKWVDGKDGPVVVQDVEEEASVLAEATSKKRSKES